MYFISFALFVVTVCGNFLRDLTIRTHTGASNKALKITKAPGHTDSWQGCGICECKRKGL